MTLHTSVVSNLPPLQAIFDLLNPSTPAQVVLVAVETNPQEQQAAERRHLVNRINDLCDCV